MNHTHLGQITKLLALNIQYVPIKKPNLTSLNICQFIDGPFRFGLVLIIESHRDLTTNPNHLVLVSNPPAWDLSLSKKTGFSSTQKEGLYHRYINN